MRKKIIIFSVIGILFIIFFGGMIWSNTSIQVTKHSVTSPKLPESFDGFRVVLVSDLHNTSFGKDNQTLLEIIRESSPDIIVITGDLVDFYDPNIEMSVAFMEEAIKIAPCFYVNGNHETRMTMDYPVLREQLIQLGVTVLEDSSVNYERNGQSICIAGLYDNVSASAEYINTILQDSTYDVLLSHRPDHTEAYEQSNADLVLSGHTHGGQLRLPFIGAVFAPGQGLFPQYDKGMFTLGNATLIISQGLGNSSIPFRFNCRPELVIIDMSAE